jgi:nucleoside-diphosphate-sugar epimerase
VVTGASGLLGSCTCRLGVERGFEVLALVRPGSDPTMLESIGARVMPGDVTDPEALRGAIAAGDAVVHAAALLGGTWAAAGAASYEAVNFQGTANVLDAARARDAGRVVVIGTIACLQSAARAVSETSPIPAAPADESPYSETKRRALELAERRAESGQDLCAVVPGGIYGEAPATERALAPTSFNRTLVMAAKGRLRRYARVRLPWSYATDVADVALLALERGRPGRRYLAMGRTEEEMTVAGFLNLGCELAGLGRPVVEVAPSDDPAYDEEFGSMAGFARRRLPEPLFDDTRTLAELGHRPVALRDGVGATMRWLAEIGEL